MTEKDRIEALEAAVAYLTLQEQETIKPDDIPDYDSVPIAYR